MTSGTSATRPFSADSTKTEQRIAAAAAQETFVAEYAQVGDRVFSGAPGDRVVNDPTTTTEEQTQPKQLNDAAEEPQYSGGGVRLNPGQHNRRDQHH